MKVAAAFALAVTGGTLYAAETGALPDRVQQTAHDLFSALGVPAPATSDGRSGASASTGARPSAAPNAHPTPSGPSALELCQAWDAAQKDPRDKAIAGEALRALLDAAGGDRSVPTFCANILAQNGASASATPNPAPTPSHPGIGNGKGNSNGPGNGKGRGRPDPSNR
jgi:hypothetical protein